MLEVPMRPRCQGLTIESTPAARATFTDLETVVGTGMALIVDDALIFHGDPCEARPGTLATQGAAIVDTTTDGAEHLDGDLVVPGLVIAHHHLYSALARGMPGPAEGPTRFLEVLEKIWWRLDRALDHELSKLSARVGTCLLYTSPSPRDA